MQSLSEEVKRRTQLSDEEKAMLENLQSKSLALQRQEATLASARI